MNNDRTLLYIHIPKVGGTTLTECIYREVHHEPEYKKYGGWFCSGVYYYPTGFSEHRTKLYPPNHSVEEALSCHDLCAVVGHFPFGLHCSISKPTNYISMLRNPVDRVLSLYHHLKWVGELPHDTTVKEFLKDEKILESSNDQVYRIAGLTRVKSNEHHALETAKDNIERHFVLVGVTELFDESIVLMKRRLGWLKNLAYFSRNINPERPGGDKGITDNDKSLILQTNQLDMELYSYVKAKLLNEIRKEDSGFENEVAALRKIKTEWER